MIKIERPQNNYLVMREHRYWPIAQLVIFSCLIFGYYYALFIEDITLLISDPVGWVLPLFLCPYLLVLWRGLTRQNEFIFDGINRTLSQAGTTLVSFDDITRIQLRATNASCEELQLMLILKSGHQLELYEGSAGRAIFVLAQEIATAIDVELEKG